MRRDEWARLAAPFPPQALEWRIARLGPEGDTAWLEPVVDQEAAIRRLDDVLGVDGWSMRLAPLGSDGVVCELTVLGVQKSAVARSFGGRVDVERMSAWAFGRAAGLAGLCPVLRQGGWVDIDTDSCQPLYLPNGAPTGEDGARPAPDTDGTSTATSGQAVDAAATHDPLVAMADAPDDVDPARNQAQQTIERLMDRLRSEGLGKQAAALVVAHGGYGRTPDDARRLYRALRALLLERGAVS